MWEALKRLLSPEYLAVADPGPLGGLWVLYLALALLFAAGVAWSLRLLRAALSRATATLAWLELWLCLAGLATVAGRFLGWPGWSARIWPYSLAILALLGGAALHWRQARLPDGLAAQLRLLAISPSPPTAEEPGVRALPLTHVLAAAVHLAGIALVAGARYGWPAWAAPLILAALLAPQAPLLLRRRPLSWAGLAPLLMAYGATLLWLSYMALGITVIGWQGLAFPDPLLSLFYLDGIVLASVAWSILAQLAWTAAAMGRPEAVARWAAAGLMVVTLAWAGMVYLGKRTHGATASDPYAYAQMGVDLAENGTFLHRFALFEEVIPLGIAWAPLQPVGYHIPRNDLGDCPSVWATGASVLLAAGYLLLGEIGLYVTTPIVALLALAATWALVQEALRFEARGVRYLVAALTVALLATSPEQVDRLLVPMADASAMLFTILTLLFLLRGARAVEEEPHGRLAGWPFWLLAGVSFAWAYWVRHTQLVLILPLALWVGVRLIRGSGARGAGLAGAVAFVLAAAVAALPDIAYRWRVFGGPLATETTELPLMAVRHMGPVAWEMARAALAAGEWGYLFPLALYGGYRLLVAPGRDARRAALVLGAALVAVLLVHLTYSALRLRDLISLFPLLNLAVAYGAVTLARRARALAAERPSEPLPPAASPVPASASSRKSQGVHRGGAHLGAAVAAVAIVGWIILSLALARWAMIDNLWKRGWASFGYMRPEHRAAFGRLEELTPPGSVVGASLNAGPVALYGNRHPIRPYDSWTAEEWEIFLRAMETSGRSVYLLDDGGLMERFIAQESVRRRLVPVAELAMPIFYADGRESGWLYRLEWEP
jgi:hypothetical protein